MDMCVCFLLSLSLSLALLLENIRILRILRIAQAFAGTITLSSFRFLLNLRGGMEHTKHHNRRGQAAAMADRECDFRKQMNDI